HRSVQISDANAHPRLINDRAEALLALAQRLFRFLALCNVKIAAQNADRLFSNLVVDGAACRRYPSHLSIRANDAKFMVKSLRLLDHGVPVRFDVFDVVGMNALT